MAGDLDKLSGVIGSPLPIYTQVDDAFMDVIHSTSEVILNGDRLNEKYLVLQAMSATLDVVMQCLPYDPELSEEQNEVYKTIAYVLVSLKAASNSLARLERQWVTEPSN
jgi:hypothetical protein